MYEHNYIILGGDGGNNSYCLQDYSTVWINR
jgi:hypothetical protein